MRKYLNKLQFINMNSLIIKYYESSNDFEELF